MKNHPENHPETAEFGTDIQEAGWSFPLEIVVLGFKDDN
jgi:hypothetical protein